MTHSFWSCSYSYLTYLRTPDRSSTSLYQGALSDTVYHFRSNNRLPSSHAQKMAEFLATSMTSPSSIGEPAMDDMADRPTPTSLSWTPESRILELYKFVVSKRGKDPYFQLLEGCAVTDQTPARVFLDLPKYAFV